MRTSSSACRVRQASFWREEYESLRLDAARADENAELYVLLRSANWQKRNELKGRISGALWIRHVAEVLRRGFEEVHGERWPEEDEAFGRWRAGTRKRAFGSERPFDDPFRSKSYLAYNFGLFTGSAVRWYVEGDTEYHALSHPRHPDNGRERPLWRQVHAAMDSWNSSYDIQMKRFAIDPVTFEQIARIENRRSGNMKAADNR